MRRTFTLVSIALCALSVAAHPIDFDQIRNWTGTGPNRAALVIQFNGDTYGSDAYVWGYRWEDGQTPSGETMMKAICAASSRLAMLTQYTGSMGSTLCGVGYSLGQDVLRHVSFDFEKAKTFEFINFDYYNASSFMGQTQAPGDETPALAQKAIDAAIAGTHYIQHPIDYGTYGYPAYDYDCWIIDEATRNLAGPSAYEPKWLSAWYEGYWSYWCANKPADDWMYSGSGFSGRTLTDGAVDAWSFTQFEKAQAGGMGEGITPCQDGDIIYVPARYTTAVSPEKCMRTVGEGDHSMPLIVNFGPDAKISNMVLRIDFNSPAPDVTQVLQYLDADPAFQLDGNVLRVDADGDGKFGTSGCDSECEGEWKLDEYEDCLVLSCNDSAPTDYLLYLPEAGSPAVAIPETLSYALSDNPDRIPVFVQRADAYDNINYSWYRRTDSNPTHSNSPTGASDIVRSISTSNATLHQLTYTGNKAGTVYLHVRARTGKGSSYSYSNICHFTLLPPEIPVERIEYELASVDAPLNTAVDNALTFYPDNATYTAITYKSSDTKVATASATSVKTTKTAGSATVTAAYTWNSAVSASFDIVSSLKNPVENLAIKGVEGDVIVLNPKRMLGIIAEVTPANADIPDINVTLTGNGTGKEDYIASMYKVNYWDENNTRIQFYELSGHRAGECTLTISSTDGSNFSRTYTVRVEEQDRTPLDGGYTDGTLLLNEEWFGHTNGGMNYLTPEGDMMYQVYERENPGMSFGCTSQYATIWNDRLIAVSKQAVDPGDPLPGGGRVVVAEAATLKYIGSINDLMYGDETKSADGRAAVGATPDKAYIGTSNGIYIIDLNDVKVTGKITDFDESGSTGADLYSGQIGDLIHAGKYVFGIKQNTGAFAIDVTTDQVIRKYPFTTVQGITQTADGHVWIASTSDGGGVFTCIDPVTLDVVEDMSVTLPAEVGAPTCSWGAWRNTPFVGCHSRNTIWFSTGGGIAGGSSKDRFYGWEVGTDPAGLVPVFDLGAAALNGSNARVYQKTYGTLRYDDRSGRLIVMTTEDSASGHYRYNWTHFIDPATGKITNTIALEPYYWFQAFAIFPDKHDVQINLDNLSVDVSDGAKTIDLSELLTDPDNIDFNINATLTETAQTLADETEATPCAGIALEGKTLTISPLKSGTHYFTLAAESNGRTVSKTVGVEITDRASSITDAATATGSIACDGSVIRFNGLDGTHFDLYDLGGRILRSFDVEGYNFTAIPNVPGGVYILNGSNGIRIKIILDR